ncbi:MMPL family transporter [Ramlibacter ginsenosidimutans]|uniref:MMPL family transporter n=1 Tax=Ramlibacter ginsenosidimutans TaxID=502333 RepID=UPI00362C7D74
MSAISPPRRWRHPAPWIWLAAMAIGLWWCTRAVYVADLSAFLPSSPTPEQRVLMAQLKNGATGRVLMIGLRGGTAAERTDASRRLAVALRQSNAFEAVHNGEESEDEAVGRLLFEHRYLLSPGVDAQRFTVEGLRDAIDETVSLLGTPAGTRLGPLLWRDPTGETARMAEAMMPAAAPRVEEGVWVSRTQPRALLLATTRADGADLDAQQAAQQLVRSRFAGLHAAGLQLELSGPGVFAVQSRATIESEVKRLAIAGSIAMLAVLLVAFGSLRPLVIAVLPVASGVVAGIVTVSLATGHVHGLTLGFGTTLIGEAVDYGIYYLVQAHALGRAGWLRAQWPTVRLGLATSVAGFAALVVSGWEGLAQLGIFAVSGLLAAGLTTRYLLPVLAPEGAAGAGLRARLARATAACAAALPRWRVPLLALSIAAVLALVWLPSPWRGSLSSLSPVPQAALDLDASLRADLGAPDAGVIVAAEARDEAGALAAAERIGQRLDALVRAGQLASYQSPARILPSPATQLARRAALPDGSVLQQRLAEATLDGPLPAGKLLPFVGDVQAQRDVPVLHRADFEGTPLAAALDALLLPGRPGTPWTAVLMLQPAAGGMLPVATLRQSLAGLPTARVLQVQPELDGIYAGYLRQARWQAAAGALAVVLLLAWHLRSARRLARVLLPLAASVVLVLAGLSLSGAALGVLHLVGLLLVVAIGSNYALFFDHLALRGEADADTLASLLMANLTTVVSFGLLATARVPALADVGMTVAPGALLSLLLAAAFSGRARQRAAGAV